MKTIKRILACGVYAVLLMMIQRLFRDQPLERYLIVMQTSIIAVIQLLNLYLLEFFTEIMASLPRMTAQLKNFDLYFWSLSGIRLLCIVALIGIPGLNNWIVMGMIYLIMGLGVMVWLSRPCSWQSLILFIPSVIYIGLDCLSLSWVINQ